MLTKFISTILVLFNPVGFLVADSVEPLIERPTAAISSILSTNPNFLPIRDWEIEDPEVEAKSSIVFNLEKNKVLYEKESNRILPIASLTKIMTALVTLENLELNEKIIVSENAIKAYGNKGNLVVGEELTVKEMLHALLMESSNDAAMALAEKTEEKTDKNFVSLMNKKVDDLGLVSTRFSDPTGLNQTNISTVRELVKLVKYSFKRPVIWEIMKTPEINLAGHHWINTDELLNQLPNVIGGKTGYTTEAQGCLILVVERQGERIVSVVLGAQERFLETEKLIKWVERAYLW